MGKVRDRLEKGINTSSDTSDLIVALMGDVVDGQVDISTAGVLSKCVARLLQIKALEMSLDSKPFVLSHALPAVSAVTDRHQKCNQCSALVLPKDLGEHKRLHSQLMDSVKSYENV